MDALTGLLDGPRARGAFLLRGVLEPPWALRVQDRAPITVLAQVRGASVVRTADGTTARLAPGDVAVVRGPEPYLVADDVGTPPQAVIHPGQQCTTPDGVALAEAWYLGVRAWGNAADGSTHLVVGTYELAGEVSGRLLRALPQVVVVPRGDEAVATLVSMLAAEIGREEPGQTAVLDRLLDLLLITALRSWFAREGAGAPAWYRAWADPVAGAALRRIHQQPAEPWTVVRLADAAGVSRAAFARRFTDLVGESPMAYLTAWRIALAADLLTRPDATLAAVARQVGYSTPFALSTAFKRVRGVSPRSYRERLAEV
ncbi:MULTISPECIES: AraC family transcriptional regulator [unclassified Actinotalea]|uniref:AraC family transcriptional regulator n=1 Tax=unclassified Actinotalea TaxID=2638618 RepID=UPI0015F54C34|nr:MULTISPECIES: AraC family transcriptional regulator [unclassified Actinotalea]